MKRSNEQVDKQSHLMNENLEAFGASGPEKARLDKVSNVSHALRTPLTTIIGSLSALKVHRKKIDDGDIDQLIENALTEAHCLDRMIQDIFNKLKQEMTSES